MQHAATALVSTPCRATDPETSARRATALISWLRSYAATRVDSRSIDERRCIPPHIVMDLGNQGLLGMYVPESHGGLGLRTVDLLRVLEQLSAIDLTLAVFVLDAALGAHTLLNAARPSLRDEYLRDLARGRVLTSIAITEPAAGSHPRAMECRAVSDGPGRWRLYGEKLWVGNAAWSSLINVFVQHVDADGARSGISGFAVRQGAPGLTIGAEALTLGMRGFVKNQVTLDGVLVTEADLLGPRGAGMEAAQGTMMFVRLCLGHMAVGSMKRAAQLMHRYAAARRVATGLLIEDPVVLERLTDLTASIAALESLTLTVGEMADSATPAPGEAMIACKVAGSELMGQAADLLVQTLGARGYEECNPAAQMFRDARPFRIWEGPTEALSAYLGSASAHEFSGTQRFIARALAAPAVADRLAAASREVHARCAASQPADAPFAPEVRGHAIVGTAAVDALLWAAAERAHATRPGAGSERAARRAAHRFERNLAGSLATVVDPKLMAPVTHVTAAVDSYAAAIGDVEQSRTGVNLEIDPLLRRAPITTTSTPSDSVRRQLLVEWNNTAQAFPSHTTIHALFEEQVARTPNAPALEAAGRAFSYDALNRHANRLARTLLATGVGPGARIALCFERSPAQLVALLATLKVGAAYVPIDPRDPEARRRAILEETAPALLLTHGAVRAAMATDVPSLCVELEALPEERNAVDDNVLVAVGPEDPAYVIFTSGSTGRPKGVVVSHRALVNFAWYARDSYEMRPNDRVLQFASLSFDAAAEEIYPAWFAGACLVLRDEEMSLSPARLADACARLGLTVLDLPTAFWHQLVAAIAARTATLPAGVRLVIIGGERAEPEQVAAWRAHVGSSARLLNTYGPTETTVVATVQDLTHRAAIEAEAREVPIGRPIANTRAYVLDADGALVAPGAEGELFLGGAGVALGYLHRPELTAERFVRDPFAHESDARMYRTGDRVRQLSDGTLEFLGRVDHQVKIRGRRVELGEIEAVLNHCDGVTEAVVVVVREDSVGGLRLAAHVVLAGGRSEPPPALFAQMSALLPEYMVPTQVHVVEALPRTASGKIDRAALPATPAHVRPRAHAGRPPRTATERALAAIWSDVLRAEVGAEDNFFALGGHSLLVARIASLVAEKLGAELPITAIFEHPTVAALAALLDAAGARRPAHSAPVAERQQVEL
jgi:amino acid adenylation domain-containing protein